MFDYDKSDIQSVYLYAKKLEGMTFGEILDEYEKYSIYKNTSNLNVVREESAPYGVESSSSSSISINRKAKGLLGNLIEKYYFGYEINGKQEADFSEIGVELKQTPIDILKNGQYRAGERLSITNISYEEPVEHNFYKSHVWEKIKCILLVQYLRDKSKDDLDYIIKFVNLFTPPEADLDIIIEDYNTIISKIEAGQAHELSEGDTLYLGACTKGSTAQKSLRPQYYNPNVLAKKRNFCFKTSYMNYVLQNYVLNSSIDNEKIIREKTNLPFKQYVLNKINQYIGMTDQELCALFGRIYNNNKAQWKDLGFRMLGIKSNQAEEFEKANIVMKSIRIEQNGRIKESMSFSPFKFTELAEEEWEDSELFNYFDQTQFLFVIFRNNGINYTFEKAMFWHMPYNDLNEIVKKEWMMFQAFINYGIQFMFKTDKNGKISVENNLPGMKDTEIIHVRPHAQKAAYKLHGGLTIGNIYKDGDVLPNGEIMTKQSFWLNRSYVLKQLKVKGGEDDN